MWREIIAGEGKIAYGKLFRVEQALSLETGFQSLRLIVETVMILIADMRMVLQAERQKKIIDILKGV